MIKTKLKNLSLLTNPAEVKKIINSKKDLLGLTESVRDISVSTLQSYQDQRSYNVTLIYKITMENDIQKNIVASTSWPVSNEYGYFAGKMVSKSLGDSTPVKIPAYYTYIKKYNLILREYVSGERLSKKISKNKDIGTSHVDSLMNWLAIFQKIKSNKKVAVAINLYNLENNFKILRKQKPEEVKALDEEYEKIKPLIIEWSNKHNQTLVHGDLNPANIMIDNNELAVIDFENVYRGDRVADIANLSVYITILQEEVGADNVAETEKNLISAYEKYSDKLNINELERFYVYKKYFILLFKSDVLVWK